MSIDITDILIAIGLAVTITGLAFINPYAIIVLVGVLLTVVGFYRRD